ncbi:MAG: ATP-binding protein [Treponema sp.]|nr:ATP-binding protein [Treponema sp.]
MVQRSIKSRIIVPIVVILTVLVIVMTIDYTQNFTRYTGILFRDKMNVTASNLNKYLLECEHNSKVAAISVSQNLDIIRAVNERNTDKLRELLSAALDLYGVDFFIVTDESGDVLFRTHMEERSGDSILGQKNIQEALEGRVYSCIEEGSISKVSIRTGSPVHNPGGELIGVISSGTRLDAQSKVDDFKRFFDIEVTVFYGDTRAATTIETNGNKITGTHLSPAIAKTVLEDGEEYFGYDEIQGDYYSTYYKPLKNPEDQIFAILSVAYPVNELIAERNGLIRNGILIGLAGLVISITALLFIIVRITRPINRVVQLVSEVTSGNVNVEINRGNVFKDEIGILTLDVYSLIDVVKSMTNDLSHLTRDLNIYGDINYLIDADKYSGSYKEIIDGIKTLADSISMMKKTMAVMDYLDTMISVVDYDYNLLYINRSLAEQYGVDRKSCLGRKCYKVIRKLDEPCSICQLQKILSNGSFVSTYHDAWDACTGMWLGGRAAIVNWIDGSKVFLNSFYDETEKKTYEMQLHEALKKMEQASAAKSAFLANMSHEIRTPMNSIVGFSELALDGDVSEKTGEYLGIIKENSKWLLQIINDILDISKIESGNMELEHIPFDLNELITASESTIASRAIIKNIRLSYLAEPITGKKLIGDPTRLRQVLINLLSNAVKFTDSGEVSLFVGIENAAENTVTLRFEVKDTGIGMTPAQAAIIFEPFIQADTSTTRKYGGTGLGLAITQNILHLMDSALEVESRPGQGSTFSFTLTFDTVDVTSGTHDAGTIAGEIKKPLFNGEVLVCEDNQMNQRLITEHLARVGLGAEIAVNGREGIARVKNRIAENKEPYDLILMDIHMPVMDGIEAASKIMELGTGTPVIAMTANVMTEDVELYKNLGMNDYIGKPFTARELWRVLLKNLEPVSFEAMEKNQSSEEEDLQKQLKKDFVKINQTKFDEIAGAIESGDTALARRLTHTLKTNAGIIGKFALQKAAEDIEHTLKNNETAVTGLQLNRLKSELSKALKTTKSFLKGAIKPSQLKSPAPVMDTFNARELFEELEALLKGGNPESLKLIDRLCTIPGSDELIEQIEDFSFTDAVKTLAGLKEKFADTPA